jgi:hypothetical protein
MGNGAVGPKKKKKQVKEGRLGHEEHKGSTKDTKKYLSNPARECGWQSMYFSFSSLCPSCPLPSFLAGFSSVWAAQAANPDRRSI